MDSQLKMNTDTFLTPTYTDDQDLFTVEDYEKVPNYYLLSLVEGKKYKGNLKKEISYFIDSSKKPTDFISEPHGVPICSLKLTNLILNYEKNIQKLNAPLYDLKTKNPIKGFYILNFLNLLENSFDMKLSKFSGYSGRLIEPIILESKILESVFSFRLKESPYRLYFRKELALAIYKEKMTGIEFLKTNSI